MHSTAIVPTSSRYFSHCRSKFNRIFQFPLTFLTLIVVFQLHWFFQSSFKTFQFLQSLSKFICTFEPQPEISNSSPNFPTSIFPISFWTFQLLILSNCSFQLHVSRIQSSKITSWNQNNLKIEKRHEIEFLKCLRIYDKSIDRKLGYNLVF